MKIFCVLLLALAIPTWCYSQPDDSRSANDPFIGTWEGTESYQRIVESKVIAEWSHSFYTRITRDEKGQYHLSDAPAFGPNSKKDIIDCVKQGPGGSIPVLTIACGPYEISPNFPSYKISLRLEADHGAIQGKQVEESTLVTAGQRYLATTIGIIKAKAACPKQMPLTFPMKTGTLETWMALDAVVFKAGLEIDADGAPNAYGPNNKGLDYTANARGPKGWVGIVTGTNGNPVIQKTGDYSGYYVSTTSLQDTTVKDIGDPKRYVDATRIPYIALPPEVASRFNILLGDLAMVFNSANGKFSYAIYADVGPHGQIGEGSIALADALGIPSNPRHGGAVTGLIFLIFPRSGLGPGKNRTLEDIQRVAARLYREWGGTEQLRACLLD